MFSFRVVGHKNTDNTLLKYYKLLLMHVNLRSVWYLLIDGLVCKVGLQGGSSSWEALCSLPELVHISCWCNRSRERLPDTHNA